MSIVNKNIYYTRIGGIASLIFRSRYNSLNFKKIDTFIDNNPLQKDIKNSLLNEMRGVRVLCTPQGTGKTTSIKKVCRDMSIDRDISGTIYINFSQYMLKSSNPKLLLSQYTGCNLETKNLSYYINRDKTPLALVLDGIDFEYTHPNFDVFISSLAHDSVMSKKYVVLLSTSSPYLARRILTLNSGSRIKGVGVPSIYKWCQRELQEIYCNKIIKINRYRKNKDIEKIINCINISGSPGFISEIINDQNFDIDFAIKRSLDISLNWKDSDRIVGEYIGL